ncbi:MAG TPA: hypothetical protein VII44_01945 [Puia sp.]
MKKLLFILILNVSLLFSPPPKAGTTDPNGRYISLTRYAGFFLNPDTYGFIFPSIHPKQLLEYHAQRQNRPLFILAGSAMGYSITLLTWPFHKQLLHLYEKFWRGAYTEEKILFIGNFYAGYVLLNILVLWISLFLFEKIFYLLVVRTDAPVFSMFLLMVFIASNPVTKAFFWTVHTQMFAFLTPLLCIYILFRVTLLQTALSFLRLAGFFLTGGVLLLVYGNFILLVPSLLYAVMYQWKKFDDLKNWRTVLIKVCILTLLFFIPTICWIGILKWIGIDYYNFEMKVFHHLVWIPETLHRSFGSFIYQLGLNTLAYFKTMWLLLILILFSMIIFISGKIRISWENDFMRETLFVFLYFFLFYWLLGAYFERLTLTLIPLFGCFWVVVVGQKITAKKMIYVLSSLAMGWHLYVLMSYGPFY